MIDYINSDAILSERSWRPDDDDRFSIEDDIDIRLPSDDVTVSWDKLGRRHLAYPCSEATRQRISAARRRGHALRVIREAMRSAAIEEIISLASNLL